MKKLLGFAMIGLGAILLIITVMPLFFSNDTNSKVANVNESLDGIDELSLESEAIQWTIVPVDDEDLRVEMTSEKGNQSFYLERTRSQLSVHTEKKRWFGFLSYIGSSEKGEATVYLPKSFTQDLDISTVSGDITLDGDLTLDQLNIEMVSSQLMNTGELHADEIDVDSVSGHVDLMQVTSSDLQADTVSGDVNVEYANDQGDLTIDTVSGKVEVTVPDWNAAYDLDTLSGTMMDQGTRVGGMEFSSSKGDGDAEVTISTLSGNITLK